jgi:hypothetical protein
MVGVRVASGVEVLGIGEGEAVGDGVMVGVDVTVNEGFTVLRGSTSIGVERVVTGVNTRQAINNKTRMTVSRRIGIL